MGYINLLELKFLLNISLVVLLVNGHGTQTESQPEFLAPLGNLSVPKGRNVSFACMVNNPGQYKVAWIKSDSKSILVIHTHVVPQDRFSVVYDNKNTWTLHISNVQLDDSGIYTCLINTDPIRLQSGYLDVVEPPDILEENESNRHEIVEVNEDSKVQLVCRATGVPKPTVKWVRENGKHIVIRMENWHIQVLKFVEGERLVLNRVQWIDMDGYLCIASNGVEPSVSKRFDVLVNFSPDVKVAHTLVAAPVGSHVLLQCIVEAFPAPFIGWYRHDVPSVPLIISVRLEENEKFIISEDQLNAYSWKLDLTIKNLQLDDFGSFVCTSINIMGRSNARIRLQVLHLPTKPTINEKVTTLEATSAGETG